jgi:hypothetical protein
VGILSNPVTMPPTPGQVSPIAGWQANPGFWVLATSSVSVHVPVGPGGYWTACAAPAKPSTPAATTMVESSLLMIIPPEFLEPGTMDGNT